MTQFDEDTAIDYMRKAFEAETGLQAEYDDDQLLNIIDMIWDYYEQNGLLDVASEPVCGRRTSSPKSNRSM